MKKNNSVEKPYYSQRNNALKPEGACNVTAMISALSAAGWPVEKLADKTYPQPEDALMHFMLADPDVDKEWHRIDRACRFPPNEWHPLLAFGTNKFLEKKGIAERGTAAVCWGENRYADDLKKAIDGGGSAVVSGLFEFQSGKALGHVVAVVGYKTDDAGKLASFTLDDPWGNYHTKYADANGNDIDMPVDDFVSIIRSAGSALKCGHIVYKYGGAA